MPRRVKNSPPENTMSLERQSIWPAAVFRCFVFPLTSTSSSEADLESRPQCEYKAFPEVNNETTLKQGEPGTLQFEKWANASELKLLCLKASINETWLRVRGPSCSSPLTIGLFFCQPGRGDSSGNGFLKQLEGVKGSCDSSLGPISSRRRFSSLRIVWYWITLIRPLPFSQRHLHYSLTFVVREPTFFASSFRHWMK